MQASCVRTKKPRKERSDYPSNHMVKMWITKHDIEFFSECVSLTEAADRFFAKTGQTCSRVRLSAMRVRHAKYWGVKTRRPYSDRTTMTESHKSRMRSWMAENRDVLARASTVIYAARVMRSDGVICSPSLLEENKYFMRNWKAAREGKK